MPLTRLFHALRARPAVLAAGALLLICVVGFLGALRPPPPATSPVLFTNAAPLTVTTLAREPVPVVTGAPARAGTNAYRPFAGLQVHVGPAARSNAPAPSRPGLLDLHAPLPPHTNGPPPGLYAPAGRLLRCQLVNTVDSAVIDTPLIALVTDDLWHQGRLIVPAGTEVHSRVRVDRLRERLVASGAWVLVWQSGQELTVNGVALDRGDAPDGPSWELTDGSAGLRGEVLRSDSMDEVKLFAATFLSGMAGGLQQTRDTIYGTQVTGNVRNAALGGTSQVLNAYAQQILQTIQRDGVYVRVPAGKRMYLYLTETLDLSQARVGNLRVASPPAPVAFPSLNPNPRP